MPPKRIKSPKMAKATRMGKRFRWWDGRVGPHSLPLILTTSVGYGKLPAMYNCVLCVCICVIVSLMVWFYGELRFQNIGTMFTQRGEVCNGCELYEQQCCF